MGKKLIIRNADFYQNCIDKTRDYLLNITDAAFNAQTEVVSWGQSPYKNAFSEQLNVIPANTVIAGVRIKTNSAGTIPVYVASFASNTSVGTDFIKIADIVISQTGIISDFLFPTPVTILSNQCIVFGDPINGSQNAGKFYYGAGPSNLRLSTDGNLHWQVSTMPLGVDYILG